MTKGIYVYESLKYGYASYVGKDSNIHINKRWYDHKKPCMRNEQPFNKVLQDNFEDFKYRKILEFPDSFPDYLLEIIERRKIKKYRTYWYDYPKKHVYNFQKGGHNPPIMRGESHPLYGTHRSKETKKKISEGNKGKTLSDETKKKISESTKGKSLSYETKRKISESKKGSKNPQWVNYARITKKGFSRQGKQQYAIKFNGKHLKQSINVNYLIDWFLENYPKEPLYIKINRGEI